MFTKAMGSPVACTSAGVEGEDFCSALFPPQEERQRVVVNARARVPRLTRPFFVISDILLYWVCEVKGETALILAGGQAFGERLMALCVPMLGGVARDTALLHRLVAPDVGAGEATIFLEDNPDAQ